MPISMYQASVPVLVRALNNLSALLEKGAAHAEAKKLEQTSLTGYRLFPDMLPFTAQINIACDITKNGVARLAGIEPPKFEDTETTFPQLIERIRKTIEFIQSVPAAAIDGSEEKDITLPMRAGPVQFKGMNYLLGFILPNVYFHSATAYSILRHNGVEIGKMDFLGKLA